MYTGSDVVLIWLALLLFRRVRPALLLAEFVLDVPLLAPLPVPASWEAVTSRAPDALLERETTPRIRSITDERVHMKQNTPSNTITTITAGT